MSDPAPYIDPNVKPVADPAAEVLWTGKWTVHPEIVDETTPPAQEGSP
jgi:hypothetical protein